MKCKCLYCKKDFEVKYPSNAHKFCSKTCSMNYRWEHKERNVKSFTCETCGKKFIVPKSDHRIKEGQRIRFCSHKCCGESNKKGTIKICPICGKEFYTTRHSFCSVECARKNRVINGKHKAYYENGYIVEYKNGYNKKGNVKQHRRIMEEYLGRKLEPNEVVHHKNGNKEDNRIENLEVMTRSQHSKYHRELEKEQGKKFFREVNT